MVVLEGSKDNPSKSGRACIAELYLCASVMLAGSMGNPSDSAACMHPCVCVCVAGGEVAGSEGRPSDSAACLHCRAHL